ncbi:Vesicle-fusing ATPase [Geodia barretti]|uniref:Vesicle-fusing ATPase n=1 Tax=Geodia barretti TaxID=519541 RepID=A0AA35TWD4_GEOBA|nr:Vesicle-fusing ATPase [Geodia barretti]
MYLPHGYLSCGESHDTVVRLTLDLLHMLRHSPASQIQTLLLYGPRGSGKTALAAHLAMVGKFSFVKFLSASSVVGRSSLHKMEAIHAAFSGAFSSSSSSSSTDLSLVVLDDLHRLVEFMKVGTQITVSHELLHTITTLLTSPIPTGLRVLVVGTLTVEEGVALEDPQFLGLPNLFLHHHLVPLLDCDATLSFLNASNIHKFGSGQFSLPSNLLVSVRQLHQAIQCACVHGSCSSDHREPSVVRQDHLLDCIMASVTRQMAALDTEL